MTSVEHLYVHAPFCARRCPYCDFAVKVRRSGGNETWCQVIAAELGFRRAQSGIGLATPLKTLFVGGGTPSLLGVGAMPSLRKLLPPGVLDSPDLEWTVEANPESFTLDLARDWKAAGVTRLSLGVQSFDPGVLRWMGRLHGADGARSAVTSAREAGFSDLSLDLIFGLPLHLERDLDDDLDRALEMEPSHLSLYGLSSEMGTPLARWIEEGREPALDDEVYSQEYLRISQRLSDEGFRHYEVSNFALPGHESIHNRAYWSGAPYLGVGNGSHSFLPPRRFWNIREWDEYTERVGGGEDPTEGDEVLTSAAKRLEATWLSLRTGLGLGLGARDGPVEVLARSWAEQGLARIEDRRVILTPEGWLLLDRLSLEMVEIVNQGS